jgi:hypothetical protein
VAGSGEVVLFYLERIAPLAAAAGLERPLADYFTCNVYVTRAGCSVRVTYVGRWRSSV